ncbi:hypothetical protein [Rhodoferax koreensis]|nr:hypothetical protein [Rhodoferax koreense]
MKTRVRKTLLYGAALLGLAMVFAMYTRPDFLVSVADQLWACF